MFVRAANGRASGAGTVGARPGRQIAVWLAIFGLYVQLFAAALCTSAAAGDALTNGVSLCHSAAANHDSAPAPDRAHHDCPFCAIHCHGAVVASPSLGIVENFVSVLTQAPVALYSAPAPTRSFAGASPRGPPV
ncbi:MAG TPA: DUF2946 family protein [Methylovirgula sp.]|nr:DUF2946 family protein [Methylovirgula sp.]